MANQYCKSLSNSYRFSAYGDQLMYQPCCWGPSVPVNTVKDLYDMRLAVQNEVENNTQKYCYECIYREDTGYRLSGRQEADCFVPEEAIDGEAYMLEYQIDTNCNAACAMCGPQFSSLWAGQTRNFDALYEKMFNLIDFNKVCRIKFFGGEPLLGDAHTKVLTKVVNPAEASVLYSTNGSIVPNADTLSLWGKFKQIRLSMSIDGIGQRFEYIRWPLKFAKIENNLKKFQTLNNVEVTVHCTVSPMNLLFVPELEQWADSVNVPVSYSPCTGSWEIGLTSSALRTEAIKQLGTEHPVIKILSKYNERGSMHSLVENMNNLDQQRQTNWRNSFPGIADLIGG